MNKNTPSPVTSGAQRSLTVCDFSRTPIYIPKWPWSPIAPISVRSQDTAPLTRRPTHSIQPAFTGQAADWQ